MAKQIELFGVPADSALPIDATPDLANASANDLAIEAHKEVVLDVGDGARSAILQRLNNAFGGNGKVIAFSGVMIMSGPDAGKLRLTMRGPRVIQPRQYAAQRRAGTAGETIGEVVDK